MPVRPNPYVGSGATYGSRGLTPMNLSSGGSGVALPLAQLVGGIIESANYDPTTDLSRQNALKVADDLRRRKEQDVIRAQNADLQADPYVPLGDIAANLSRVGIEPEEVGKSLLLANAVRGPQDGQSIDDALMNTGLLETAAGRSGGSTFAASTYGTRKKPTNVMVDGQPQIVAAEDATGQTPVLNMGEQQGVMLGDLAASMSRPEKLAAVNAEPQQVTPYTVRNADGSVEVTDSRGAMGPGRAIVSATGSAKDVGIPTGVKTDLMKSNLALDNFKNLIGMARGIAQQDPTLFGATGEVRRFGQGVAEQIKNVGMLVGSNKSDLDGVFQDVLADAAAKGIVIPGIGGYDPNLNDIVKLSTLLRYAGASALAGQENRSVSDNDIKQFTAITGDPSSVLSSQQGYLSGLDLMENIANRMGGTNAAALGQGGLGNLAAGSATPGAAPAPKASPAADPAAELPSGAKLIGEGRAQLPDGTILKWVP